MPRGGARPGAGRKASNPKTIAKKDGRKGLTLPNGNKSPEAPDEWPFGRKPEEPEDSPKLSFTSPLEYWQHILADPNTTKSEKAAAAYSMAPYVHAKIAPAAKKEEAKSKAKTAGAGKFKAAPAPLKLVAGR